MPRGFPRARDIHSQRITGSRLPGHDRQSLQLPGDATSSRPINRVSGGFVTDPDQDYDWHYNRERVYPSFSADLSDVSNVSYAHAHVRRSAEGTGVPKWDFSSFRSSESWSTV